MESKEIELERELSYINIQIKYLSLKKTRLIEEACMQKKFENAKKIKELYFDENVSIIDVYAKRKEAQKFCLNNIKEKKKLDVEINNEEKKLIKAKSKLEK